MRFIKVEDNGLWEVMVTMDIDGNSQMLNPKEVADILGVHLKTVHLWLRTGKMEGVKISYRAWRIPKSSLANFIEKNKNISPEVPSKIPTKQPVTSQKIVDGHEKEGKQDTSHQTKMKHYIRDIMGEKSNNR